MSNNIVIAYTPKPNEVIYYAAVVVRDEEGPPKETIDNDLTIQST